MLHLENLNTNQNLEQNKFEQLDSSASSANLIHAASLQLNKSHDAPTNILLSTCIIDIRDTHGNYFSARAILDSGSQIHVMSQKLLQSLGLSTKAIELPIVGVNSNVTKSNSITKAHLKSRVGSFAISLDFYILDKVTNCLPSISFKPQSLSSPTNLTLADPQYFKSSEIDLLIGPKIFYELLLNDIIQTNHKGLVLQKSVFGWLVGGRLPAQIQNKNNAALCNVNTLQELNNKIASFWETEEISINLIKSEEERACEIHFQRTIKRNESGRLVASLPWKSNPNALGDSLKVSERRFLNLEKKLNSSITSKLEYDKFLQEYLNLGHMREIGELSRESPSGYYLPHHAVYKSSSITTKIRVVFDASAKTSTGVSLNDVLLLGPVIQNDLFTILVRFRLYRYVLTADISKMYRQILINPEETKFQKILYRFDSKKPIKVFELSTLTYGTKPASFIATRCLKQLALDTQENDPIISQIIENDFNILLTGGDNAQALKKTRERITEVLLEAGFPLLKWVSNNPNILDGLNAQDNQNLLLACKDVENLKTLGVY